MGLLWIFELMVVLGILATVVLIFFVLPYLDKRYKKKHKHATHVVHKQPHILTPDETKF